MCTLLIGAKQCKYSFGYLFYRYKKLCTIARKEGSGRPSKITSVVLSLVEQQMRSDDETTASQLHELLLRHGIDISLRSILRSRDTLGWTFRGSAYCQLIRDANKLKRLEWARNNLHNEFNNVIWTDEASVQLETHRRFSYRKAGEPPTLKPRAKHPVKVHVWAGISKRGATKICIFSGIMDAAFYTEILSECLLPFLNEKFPNGEHFFMQDNDPKHVSRTAQQFFEVQNINWWKTPPESPDLNPIENLWHELKEYLRAKVKPKNLTELIAGIKKFWSTVTPEKCTKYIRHLRKVVPKVLEVNGAATGY